MFAAAVRGKAKKDENAKPEKKWTKVVNVYLEGPDGAWIVRLQGGEKTVDKFKADFMKFVKSVKVVEGSAPEKKDKGKKSNN